ncbi:MAG TPA: hypothetical protein VK212_00430 [Lentimicrobium sp.]|nr:hypothetical protein [Lentimicrobium sp.]
MALSKRYSYNFTNSVLCFLIILTITACHNKLTIQEPPADASQLAFERDLFKTYVNEEITTLKGDFRVIVQKFNEAKTKFGSSKDTLIQNKIKELKASINNSLPFNFNEAQQLEHYVTDTLTDIEIAASYYLQLINLANYEGKLKESLYYDSIMQLNYAAFRSMDHKLRMGKVAETYSQLTGLEKQVLDQDEFLLKSGMLYRNLFMITGPFTSGKPILSYPNGFFRKLLKQYPNSPLADDADYLIMISYDYSDISIPNLVRWIRNYKKFLNAYPGTNYTPDIYKRLAELYLTYSQQKEIPDSEIQEYLNQSKYYIAQLNNKFPEFVKGNSIEGLNTQFNAAWYNFTWSLQIHSDKTEYQPGEPVIINYDLKNTDDKAKKYPLFSNPELPNFLSLVEYFPLNTDIARLAGVSPQITAFDNIDKSGIFIFRQGANDQGRYDTLIGVNKRYIEKWNILKSARISLNSAPGYYDLSKEGKYRITSKVLADSEILGTKLSNSLWITIRKIPLSN